MGVIVAENISKHYVVSKKQKVTALQDVSLEVQKGEIFGLLGPDGAGKTSLFRILTTLLIPDNGKAWVNGKDTVSDFLTIRKEVGYMPGRFSLYPDLTVEENLNFFANIFNTSVRENYHLIQDIYKMLEPFKHVRAAALSGGMKQKLALSCALIHRPEVLFLDEPTTGVDAVSRKEFWELLQGLKKNGMTILVSTPYMDEASLCDRVALIDKGRIMQVNTPSGLKRHFGKSIYAAKGKDRLILIEQLSAMKEVEAVYPFGEVHHVVLKKGIESIEWPDGIESFKIEPEVEDCFISLMQNHD